MHPPPNPVQCVRNCRAVDRTLCRTLKWSCLKGNLVAIHSLSRRGGFGDMPLVHVKEDETFENALRRFKRKCEKSGILSELKKRQHYEKPSSKRKRKAIAARKKVLRKLAEERRTGY